MDRRSFVLSLFGGVAAASVGGMALAQAAPPLAPTQPEPVAGAQALDPATSRGLDGTDAESPAVWRNGHAAAPSVASASADLVAPVVDLGALRDELIEIAALLRP